MQGLGPSCTCCWSNQCPPSQCEATTADQEAPVQGGFHLTRPASACPSSGEGHPYRLRHNPNAVRAAAKSETAWRRSHCGWTNVTPYKLLLSGTCLHLHTNKASSTQEGSIHRRPLLRQVGTALVPAPLPPAPSTNQSTCTPDRKDQEYNLTG